MSRRGGSRSSFGVLQIVLGVAVLLGVGIVLALMFAPEKPSAPPTSKVTYRAESPREKDRNAQDDLAPMPEFDLANGRMRDAAPAEEKKADAAVEKPFKITGTVIDLRGKTPLDGAIVVVRRVWTATEQRDWEAREAQAKLGTDQAVFRALREERSRLQLTERTRTNAEGRFTVGSDVPGDYEVEAVHRQFMKQVAKAGTVGVDDPVRDVQVGLATGASISGKVTEIGSPTPAFDVRVMIEKDGVHSARTNEKGEYKIEGIAPGDYGILVNTAGSAYKPGPTLPYQKISLQTTSQDLRNIDFEVEAAGVVWGYVRTPNNEPIKGADVLLTAPQSILSQAITAAIRQAPPVRGRSEEDGYYELLGVPINEEWRVYATAKEASPQLAEAFMLTSEVRSVQIDVFMYGGSDVHGIVVDSSNQPIPDANVACIPSYSAMLSPLDAPAAFRDAKSGPDGTFTIEKLPVGDYQLLGRKNGFKIPTVGSAIYPDGYSEINGVEVRLLPVDEGRNWVAGVVTDVRTKEAIGGASVTLSGFGSETLNNFSREASSDSSGAFQIDGLEAGMYRLRVEKEGYAPKTIGRVLLNQETQVALNQSAVVRGVVLVREGNRPPTVEYRVAPSAMTPDGNISLFGTDELGEAGGTTFTNLDGSYQLFLPPGMYRLEASATGYTRGRQVVTLAAGQVAEGVNLYLSESGASVAGVVSVSGGGSPTGTTVTLVELGNVIGGATPGAQAPQTVGDDGYFVFENLVEGSYYAVARNASYANAKSRTVFLGADEQINDLDIKMGSGGSIEGRVYRNGKPQIGATVIAASIESGSTGQAITQGDGAYEISDLGAGEYTVTWIPAGTGQIGDLSQTTSRRVTVTEGQIARLDFGLNGATLAGQCTPGPFLSILPINFAILQEVGSPLPAAPGQAINVEQLLQIPMVGSVQIDAAGSFVFEGIPEGVYQISIYYGFPGGGGGGGGGSELRLVGYEQQVTAGNGPPVLIQTTF